MKVAQAVESGGDEDVGVAGEVFVCHILFGFLRRLEIEVAPAVFGASAGTLILRLDYVLGFTVLRRIQLQEAEGCTFIRKALIIANWSICRNSFTKH
jgi:hypothetical protein